MNHSNPAESGRTPTRPLSVEEVRTVFERTLDRNTSHMSRADTPPPPALLPPAPAGAAEVDINAMMGLSDREFIETAYGAILGRTPDETGIQHFMSILAAKGSRIAVLGALRYSPEGRAVGAVVPGLRLRFLVNRLYQLPVVGRLFRIGTGLLALPGLMRDVTSLAAELRMLREQTERGDRMLELEMKRRTDNVERAIQRGQDVLNDHAHRLDRLLARVDDEPWAESLVALAEQGEREAARLDELARTIEILARNRLGVAELIQTVAAIRHELGLSQENAALARQLSELLSGHRNLARQAVAVAEENRAELRDQERRLSLILHEVRGWIAHGVDQAALERVQDHQNHLLDPLYVAFEDRFRGSRADIKGRQRVYLDMLRQAGAGQAGRPIVDVGSGRGELLELLSEEGLVARGVDMNESMVGLCTRAGLDCVMDDAIAYLKRLDPGSLGAVTGFHIIEHLPFEAFVALLDASLRALAPGGVIIFETPNPANLMVASRWFYLDPTHRNPLPAEMVSMIAEARGFVQVSIRELHPMPQRFQAKDDVLAAQLDALFHGPQDYALIARKA